MGTLISNTGLIVIFLYLSIFVSDDGGNCAMWTQGGSQSQTDGEEWHGKWFPHSPGLKDDNPSGEYQPTKNDLYDSKHGIQMGVPSEQCDDGQTNLEIDWDNSPVNYTCYANRHLYLPKLNIKPIYVCDYIPAKYSAMHKCMDTPITYDRDIPTFGTHRPLWPKYGEYRFLPRQRWIHNLEHGAIVMLYHPCANNLEINELRHIVINCVYRHIITPFTLLKPERPLALVGWGRRLEMSTVDPTMVKEFIRIAAKKGPEQTAKDGQFSYELMYHATVVTDKNDSIICPDVDTVIQHME